jgi:hypothetical protein
VQMGGATEPNSEQNPLVTFCEQSNERWGPLNQESSSLLFYQNLHHEANLF